MGGMAAAHRQSSFSAVRMIFVYVGTQWLVGIAPEFVLLDVLLDRAYVMPLFHLIHLWKFMAGA